MRRLTIGELGKRAGVGVETVRYYQRRGLIAEPPRRGRSFREYPDETLTMLRFIRRAKGLGFTLKEIADLLTLQATRRDTCVEVRKRLSGKVSELDAKIHDLEVMRGALMRLDNECARQSPTQKCQTLARLLHNEDGGMELASITTADTAEP